MQIFVRMKKISFIPTGHFKLNNMRDEASIIVDYEFDPKPLG
jgi:hypothetical protein